MCGEWFKLVLNALSWMFHCLDHQSATFHAVYGPSKKKKSSKTTTLLDSDLSIFWVTNFLLQLEKKYFEEVFLLLFPPLESG